MSGIRTLSEPRSTAYYYGDLERLKRTKDGVQDGQDGAQYYIQDGGQNALKHGGENVRHDTAQCVFKNGAQYHRQDGGRHTRQDGVRILKDGDQKPNPDELGEYLESNEVFCNDGAIREVPPLRDRHVRHWSLPERPKEETYSTAGTFPMPEPKEKEPLLAELEIVGRLPLTQLDSGPTVTRSRSWYLCCPEVPAEELSRESSWRYSSLGPVTAPPAPNMAAVVDNVMAMTECGPSAEDAVTLKVERDSLARALCAERARAAAAARAQDARLAELHGVIAELVRRRAGDKRAAAIPEDEELTSDQERTDDCESTTQPAGELDGDGATDADRSRTDQNSSSLVSPAELPTPRDQIKERHHTSNSDYIGRSESLVSDGQDTETMEQGLDSGQGLDISAIKNEYNETPYHHKTLYLSDRESELCANTARCCREARGAGAAEQTRPTHIALSASPGGCEARRAKIASRVRLRRTEDCISNSHLTADQVKCWSQSQSSSTVAVAVAEADAARLALDVAAQADLREALAVASNDAGAVSSALNATRARCSRLEADARVLECALARATRTAQRLSLACAVHESCSVALCGALRAADRALETYDVLLALAETTNVGSQTELRQRRPDQRGAAELVARRLLARLEAECEGSTVALGEPLLSPGPWLEPRAQALSEGGAGAGAWDEACETRLRKHAARLKSETAALRAHRPPPQLFTYHDEDEPSPPAGSIADVSAADMETAVLIQEAMCAREERAVAVAALTAERARVAALSAALAKASVAVPGSPRPAKAECGSEPRRERVKRGPSETEL